MARVQLTIDSVHAAKAPRFTRMQVAGWLALALIIPIVLGSLNLLKYRALVSGGVRAYGTILTLESENHQSVSYSYKASGVTYKGAGTAGYGNPSFQSLSQGDQLLLYYVATEPEVSSLGEPRERLQNEIVFVLSPSVLIVFSLFVRLLFARFQRLRP
jgi:hypothetical protein